MLSCLLDTKPAAVTAYSQGLIALDNDRADPNASLNATSGGLFFLNFHKISGDFNAAFYGGADSANLTLIAAFSDAAAAGSSFFGAGTWSDPTGKTYPVPGLENAPPNSSGTAWSRVEAWVGPATSYAAAIAVGSPYGASGPFQNDLQGDGIGSNVRQQIDAKQKPRKL